jgi:hypothetical protein
VNSRDSPRRRADVEVSRCSRLTSSSATRSLPAAQKCWGPTGLITSAPNRPPSQEPPREPHRPATAIPLSTEVILDATSA